MDDTPRAEISGWSIIRFFACGLVLVALSDVPSYWGPLFYFARGSLALLLFATLILPTRTAVLLLFVLALAGQDIVLPGRSTDADFVYSAASIWQMHLGPINPSWIIFGCLFWQLLRVRRIVVPLPVRGAILWFTTVPVVTGLWYGGFFTDYAGVEVVKDLKFALMLIISTILFLSILRKAPRDLTRLLAAFVGILLARHLVDLVYLVANVGPMIATGVSRGSVDSAKGAIAFLAFFGVILISTQRRLLLGTALTMASVILLVGYGTRNLWITFLLGVVVMTLLLGLRRSVPFVVLGAVLLVGGIGALIAVNPAAAAVCYGRSRDITVGQPVEKFTVAAEYNFLSRIDPVRYAQIVDVLESVGRRYAYLWGTGYGGYYEDNVVRFPRDLQTAFPQYSLDTGRYYGTHTFSTYMFLKYGLVGLICISTLWFVPGYALFKRLRKGRRWVADRPKMLQSTMLCLAAFLPTAMLQTYWSGKGLYLNGMIIASCVVFVRHYLGDSGARVGCNT